MIFEFVGWGRRGIDRMVGVLGRCILVWRSGISSIHTECNLSGCVGRGMYMGWEK
jgi:hypothetical protein